MPGIGTVPWCDCAMIWSLGRFTLMATEGAVLEIFWTGAVSGQVWVEHPLSMAASVCLKFSGGGNRLLEWQTYKVDLNNGSLLILMKFLLLFYLLCCHFFLYSLSLPHRVSFLVAFLMCPVPVSGHLKLGWGHLCPWVWQHNEENNSKKLINIKNEQLFKSTVYVCHSNSVYPPPLNLRHNYAARCG